MSQDLTNLPRPVIISDMKKTQCEGSGKPGVAGNGSVLYARCAHCGREFSAQGRKAQARMGNPWLAIPKHYAK